jgi:tetratricopeptide (TPR) repeat protein
LFLVWVCVAERKNWAVLHDDQLAALDTALEWARAGGRPHLEAQIVGDFVFARLYGSTPVSEVLARLDELDASRTYPGSTGNRALCMAMLGRFDEARATCSRGMALLEEMGLERQLAVTRAQVTAEIAALAGDHAVACEHLEFACQYLAEVGALAVESTQQGHLALNLAALGRLEEAEQAARKSEEHGDADDLVTQILWRRGRARVCAGRGELDQALAYARDAAQIAERTQNLQIVGETLVDLGDVLGQTGDTAQAADRYRAAIECFERKESIASAKRAGERLSLLGEPA